MHYKDFSFGIKEIKYGEPVIQSLQPQEFYSGVLRNNDPNPAAITLERSVTAVRSVTHSTTTDWEKSNELGLELKYTPPSATGGVNAGISYKFGYKHGSSTTDSENNQQSRQFKITTSKTLPGNSAAKYKIMIAKTRTTVSYTAKIITKFSVELDGFMRYGGGYHGNDPNFHIE